MAGYGLFAPASVLVVAGFYELGPRVWCEAHWPSRPEPGNVVDSGIYAVIRHPLFLGGAIWTVAFMLVFQSIPALVLSPLAVFCFWLASRVEDALNIAKFGEPYAEYVNKIPGWNVLKGPNRLHKG